MNAPSKVNQARDRYIPIVSHHVPLCEGQELILRCSILLMRDQASSGLRRCSDEAGGILFEIERLATLYAFRRLPLVELKNLRWHLMKLTMAANGLEMFAYRVSHPDGGTDAGG